MVACRDIITFIEQIAPCSLAEEWDNVGLLVGSRDARVERIIVCLDVTEASLKEALENKADMIVTHHPVIFKGVRRLIDDDAKGKILHTLIKNDINVYTAHTNLDFANSGVNTQLAAALGLKGLESFGEGPGKTGVLESKVSLKEFIKVVKGGLQVPFVRVVGKIDHDVQKVALFCGSFDDDLDAVVQTNADVLVTGDLKYHTALDAREAGVCIIDAGHFNTEKIVLPELANAIRENFQSIKVICSRQEEDPFKTY